MSLSLSCPDLGGQQDAVTAIERILSEVNQDVTVDQILMRVSVSVGLSFYPLDDHTLAPDQFIRQADQAMYEAKQSGKIATGCLISLKIVRQGAAQRNLQRLQVAIEEGELVLHYQPKVNMKTGQVIGLEALVRWQHPQEGLLLPDKFLPIPQSSIGCGPR